MHNKEFMLPINSTCIILAIDNVDCQSAGVGNVRDEIILSLI